MENTGEETDEAVCDELAGTYRHIAPTGSYRRVYQALPPKSRGIGELERSHQGGET